MSQQTQQSQYPWGKQLGLLIYPHLGAWSTVFPSNIFWPRCNNLASKIKKGYLLLLSPFTDKKNLLFEALWHFLLRYQLEQSHFQLSLLQNKSLNQFQQNKSVGSSNPLSAIESSRLCNLQGQRYFKTWILFQDATVHETMVQPCNADSSPRLIVKNNSSSTRQREPNFMRYKRWLEQNII